MNISSSEPRYPWGWYQFCVETSQEYQNRGEPEAAMIYWVMRYWDEEDPCTDSGYTDLCDYWEYKQDCL